jgi:ABC-2 type transport system ATP-binding protein
MSDANVVIEAEGLTRSFGSTEAVKDLSFRVEAGSVYGLLGKNGSGKTTTIRLLLGLLAPDGGWSRVLGEDSRDLSPGCRQRIGYLSEEPFPYQDLPLPALLRFVAAFFPRWDWDHTNALLRRFAVPTDKPLSGMSAGQRRLCELLLVLAQKPDLLVLDDPAMGLDVTVRREFLWAALEVARDEGKAVLFTSHVLTDVERVVDTVGVLESGRLCVQAPLEELQARMKRLLFELPVAAAPDPPAVAGELSRKRSGRDVVVVTGAYTPELEAELRRAGGLAAVEDMNLEDIFIAIVDGKAGTPPEVAA